MCHKLLTKYRRVVWSTPRFALEFNSLSFVEMYSPYDHEHYHPFTIKCIEISVFTEKGIVIFNHFTLDITTHTK